MWQMECLDLTTSSRREENHTCTTAWKEEYQLSATSHSEECLNSAASRQEEYHRSALGHLEEYSLSATGHIEEYHTSVISHPAESHTFNTSHQEEFHTSATSCSVESLVSEQTPTLPQLNPAKVNITPDSPNAPKAVDLRTLIPKQEEFESPKDSVRGAALFRPWDTPESLSPPSKYVSPTTPTNQESPTLPLEPMPSTSGLQVSPVEFPFMPVLCPGLQYIGDSLLQHPSAGPSFSLPLLQPGRKRKSEDASVSSPALAKKGRMTELPPCGVCLERATGFHYGAPVCEGCKGFFRRRVIKRDIQNLLCGRGNNCSVRGRDRIHCKLCRWYKCLAIGMSPESIKSLRKPPRAMDSLSDHIIFIHKETFTTIPALYRGRQHLNKVSSFIATVLPASADLSLESAERSIQFIINLPGFEEFSAAQRDYMSTTGTQMVMLMRFISRYLPEVTAFLFPSGEFVRPEQVDISAHLQEKMGVVTRLMTKKGFTDLELSHLCVLVACDPMDTPAIYYPVMQDLTMSTSIPILSLLQGVQQLFSCASYPWTNIQLKW